MTDALWMWYFFAVPTVLVAVIAAVGWIVGQIIRAEYRDWKRAREMKRAHRRNVVTAYPPLTPRDVMELQKRFETGESDLERARR